MNGLFEAALEIQRFMHERDWRFCIIGGLALARWGEPRATQDVDITLLTGFGDEESYIRPLLANFASRCSEPETFAIQNRVLLLRSSNGTGIDIALGGFPFEEQTVARATPFEVRPGVSLMTCSAEDLVVLKAFAGRAQDWLDIENVVVRQSGCLDWTYIDEQLVPLAELKAEPEILDQLKALREKIDSD